MSDARRFSSFWLTHKEPTKAADYILELESQLAATQQRLAKAEELIDNTYAMGFYTIGADSGLTHKDLCRKFAAMGGEQ